MNSASWATGGDYYYPDVIEEGEQFTWTLPFPGGAVTGPLPTITATLTLEDRHGNIINGRDAQDADNANGVTMDPTGGLIHWDVVLGDTTLQVSTDLSAQHLGTLRITLDASFETAVLRLWMRVRRAGFAAQVTGYVPPDVARIRQLTGINAAIQTLTDDELGARLMALLGRAETKTALQVGTAIFPLTTLAPATADALTCAVALRAGAAYLRGIATEKATASKRPHVMEDAEQIRAQADALEAEAMQYDELVKGEVLEVPAGPGGAVRMTGRARLALSTVDPYSIGIRPSERVEANDERDDLPAGVLVRP